MVDSSLGHGRILLGSGGTAFAYRTILSLAEVSSLSSICEPAEVITIDEAAKGWSTVHELIHRHLGANGALRGRLRTIAEDFIPSCLSLFLVLKITSKLLCGTYTNWLGNADSAE